MTTLRSTALPGRRAALGAGLGAVLGGVALLAGCSERGRFFALPGGGAAAFHGLAMGSSWTLKIATRGLGDTLLDAAQAAVGRALGDVERRMSHYDGESELSRLNRHPLGEPFSLSVPTRQVFAVAQSVQAASGGAFDVALGRVVDEWGFGPAGKARAVPADGELQALRHLQAGSPLHIDPQAGTVTRRAPVQANLSGIAKGYGVDRASAALDALGIGDYMVEVGGEIRTRGLNGSGQPWQLAIEQPDAMPQRAFFIVPLSGLSLATSGDYRNYFQHAGRRYSHEIDPATAAPVQHGLASVSVVAPDCTRADAWSTALFVLGPDRGPALAHRLGLAACFLLRDGDGRFRLLPSPAFQALGGQRVA